MGIRIGSSQELCRHLRSTLRRIAIRVQWTMSPDAVIYIHKRVTIVTIYSVPGTWCLLPRMLNWQTGTHYLAPVMCCWAPGSFPAASYTRGQFVPWQPGTEVHMIQIKNDKVIFAVRLLLCFKFECKTIGFCDVVGLYFQLTCSHDEMDAMP